MEEYQAKFCGEHIGRGKYLDNQELCNILSQVVSCSSVFGNEGDCGRLLEKIASENGLKTEIVKTSAVSCLNKCKSCSIGSTNIDQPFTSPLRSINTKPEIKAISCFFVKDFLFEVGFKIIR